MSLVPEKELEAGERGAEGRRVWRVGTLVYGVGGVVALFGWLLWGDFAFATRERSVGQMLQAMLREYKASNFLLAMFTAVLPAAISVLIGPWVSCRSDRHRGPRGRRIPYLLVVTPIAALGVVGLGFSPMLGTWMHGAMGRYSMGLNASVLIFFGLFWIVFEIAAIVGSGLFHALVNDVVPGELLGRFYGFFRAVSLVAGMLFGWYLFGHTKQWFLPMMVGIGVVYGGGFMLMCARVKEGSYPAVEGTNLGGTPMPLAGVGEYLRECFAKPFYVWLFLAVLLPSMAILPINLFSLYYAGSVGMSDETYGRLQTLFFSMSLVCTVPLGWAVDKFHPLRVAMVAVVLHGGAALWGTLFIHDQVTYGVAFVLMGFLSGMWFTATASLTAALLPKLKYGRYASTLGIVMALSNIAMGSLMGMVLDWSGKQYWLTYLAALVFDVLGLAATVVVWRAFVGMGGRRGYTAPE